MADNMEDIGSKARAAPVRAFGEYGGSEREEAMAPLQLPLQRQTEELRSTLDRWMDEQRQVSERFLAAQERLEAKLDKIVVGVRTVVPRTNTAMSEVSQLYGDKGRQGPARAETLSSLAAQSEAWEEPQRSPLSCGTARLSPIGAEGGEGDQSRLFAPVLPGAMDYDAPRKEDYWDGNDKKPADRSNVVSLTAEARVRPPELDNAVTPTGPSNEAALIAPAAAMPRMGSTSGLQTLVAPTVKQAQQRAASTGMASKSLMGREQIVAETALSRCVMSDMFEYGSAVILLLNGLYVGVELQLRAKQHVDSGPAGGRGDIPSLVGIFFEGLFCTVFTAELALRIAAYKKAFIASGPNQTWNIFDLFIVPLSDLQFVLDVMTYLAGVVLFDEVPGLRVLRVLRVAKIVRSARVVQMLDIFREMRMMLLSIMASMQSLMSCVAILCMCFYIFGICLMGGAVDYLTAEDKWNSPGDETAQALQEAWGQLDVTMLMLFQAMCGGADWGDIFDTLSPLSGFYKFVFILFVSFAVFVLVNVITGVFVENAISTAHSDRETLIAERRAEMEAYLRNMKLLFSEMDSDGSNVVTLEEFRVFLADETVRTYFAAIELDVGDIETLFILMDRDRSGGVQAAEFLDGCRKLSGQSRALDLAIMEYQINTLYYYIRSIKDTLDSGVVQTVLSPSAAIIPELAESTERDLDALQPRILP
eukprot:TRINITY_DN41817_c0_g1_i1.p1 TRINITY_DN41817_c0_g1~~TRINITY_DN41817_c0_g1_i1.p1  ORF type:complete len:703 (-),score=161.17 TRINITY_DN41817_c0_g1_i1:125-2233(-)